jgi:hypothetical protein
MLDKIRVADFPVGPAATGVRRSATMIDTRHPSHEKSARSLAIQKQVREILKEASESARRAIESSEQRMPMQQSSLDAKPIVSKRMRESF